MSTAENVTTVSIQYIEVIARLIHSYGSAAHWSKANPATIESAYLLRFRVVSSLDSRYPLVKNKEISDKGTTTTVSALSNGQLQTRPQSVSTIPKDHHSGLSFMSLLILTSILVSFH